MDKITEKTTPIAVTDKVNEIIDEISLKGTVSSVNGKTPDSSGNVTITAEDAGARPDTWTPTAADVGAAASNHTHTPASIGAAASGHTHSAATTSKAGFLSASDKTKLNGIATGANKYVLPVAGTALGGVKNGGNVTVNEDGTMTAPEGGGGAVESVNGKTGAVTLTASDVNAIPKNTTAISDWNFYDMIPGFYKSAGNANNAPAKENSGSTDECLGIAIDGSAQFVIRKNWDGREPWAGYRVYTGGGAFSEWKEFAVKGDPVELSVIKVTDWNEAIDTGFYVSDATAKNAPTQYGSSTCSGIVIRSAQGDIFQFLCITISPITDSWHVRRGYYSSSINFGSWKVMGFQAASDVPIDAIYGMQPEEDTVQSALENLNQRLAALEG